MSNIRYCIENEENRICYYITDESDDMQTIKLMDKQKDASNHYYDVYDIYNPDLETYEKLKMFKRDYTQWTEEIKKLYKENDYDYFDPKSYYNSNVMVQCFFKKYATKKISELKRRMKLDIPDKLETSYIEKTNNGGQTYLQMVGLHTECYGNDFSSYYGNILGNEKLNFQFPIRKGKQKKYTLEQLKKLHKKKELPFGYYDIIITSDHKDVLKVFTFSKNNCYNKYSLDFCLQYHNIYKMKFEMIDTDYNAYIYDDDDVIKSSDIFGTWFKKINEIKSKLPKNKIVKHLSSALWGYITQYNRMFITLDELMSRDDVSRDEKSDCQYLIKKHNSDTSIEIIDKNNRYKSEGLARIKSFLTAFSRDYLGRMIIREKIFDKIIRIHTDGIILTKPHQFDETYYHPVKEDKTTGNLFFIHNNDYFKQCLKCNNFYKYKYGCCPNCN